MSAPTITRMPAVVAALVEIAGDALAELDPPLQVLDGPVLGELPWQHLMIGMIDSPDTPPYSATYERLQSLGAPQYIEAWEVRCGLCLAHGDSTVGSLRDRAVEVLAALDGALRAEARRDDVWQEVRLGDAPMQWYPVPSPKGYTVLVTFSIEGSSLL